MGILADIELVLSVAKEIETFLNTLSSNPNVPANIQEDIKNVIGKAQTIMNVIHAVGL